MQSSLDFYQNLTSVRSDDYLTNEALDLQGKNAFCPQREDFGPNRTHYEFLDHGDLAEYHSVGVTCRNYTTNEFYLEQNPVVTTLHFVDGGNVKVEFIKKLVNNDSDDLLSVSTTHMSFVVRRTSNNKYGVFSDKRKVKVSLFFCHF